jgi:hypothetical protein
LQARRIDPSPREDGEEQDIGYPGNGVEETASRRPARPAADIEYPRNEIPRLASLVSMYKSLQYSTREWFIEFLHRNIILPFDVNDQNNDRKTELVFHLTALHN